MSGAMWKCPKCTRSFSREGQSHYCGKVETVDAYMEAQDKAVRPFLNEVRQILRDAIPEAEETISWSMPTYRKGRNLLHFAAAKSISDFTRATKPLGYSPGNWPDLTSARVRSAFPAQDPAPGADRGYRPVVL